MEPPHFSEWVTAGKMGGGRPPRVDSFELEPDTLLAGKYRIRSCLGTGWEGEVYLVRERKTGIERAAKLFFPHRNKGERASRFYAAKLHKLRNCPIVIQYHTHDILSWYGAPVTMLVSEYVAGELLEDFVTRFPGNRLTPFQAVHMLHSLAAGIECIHALGEYHGDLHDGNIIVLRYGLEFDLRLMDMFYWKGTKAERIREDVFDLVRLFYDVLGGQKHYAKQPPEVKTICNGLKRSLIAQKFRTAGQLKRYLENLEFD